MYLSQDDLKSPLLVTAAAVSFGLAFQLGYFMWLGLGFISLLSPGDWVQALMLLSLPVLFFGSITGNLLAAMGSAFLKLANSRFGSRALSAPAMVAFLTITAAQIAVLSYSPNAWYFIVLWALFVAVGLSTLVIGRIIENYGAELSALVTCAISWAVFAYLVGYLYGMIGGSVCRFEFPEGRSLTAVYKRSVSGGHLYQLNGRTYFVENSQVREIMCDRRNNTWKESYKLLTGQ